MGLRLQWPSQQASMVALFTETLGSVLLFLNAVQNIIGLSGQNQTTANSIDITITFNLSITNNVDIRGTATPVDDSSHLVEVTIPGPITASELRVPFFGLCADTNYTFEIEAVRRNDASTCIGVGINNLFLQTDHQSYTSGELVLVACPLPLSPLKPFLNRFMVVRKSQIPLSSHQYMQLLSNRLLQKILLRRLKSWSPPFYCAQMDRACKLKFSLAPHLGT